MPVLKQITTVTRWKKLPDTKTVSAMNGVRNKCVVTTIVENREVLEVQLECGHWVQVTFYTSARSRANCQDCK